MPTFAPLTVFFVKFEMNIKSTKLLDSTKRASYICKKNKNIFLSIIKSQYSYQGRGLFLDIKNENKCFGVLKYK